jgi:hypothetical protein
MRSQNIEVDALDNTTLLRRGGKQQLGERNARRRGSEPEHVGHSMEPGRRQNFEQEQEFSIAPPPPPQHRDPHRNRQQPYNPNDEPQYNRRHSPDHHDRRSHDRRRGRGYGSDESMYAPTLHERPPQSGRQGGRDDANNRQNVTKAPLERFESENDQRHGRRRDPNERSDDGLGKPEYGSGYDSRDALPSGRR